MRTAAARSGRSGERPAHKVAERLAKRAGVDYEDWVADAVEEYAEELGVDPRDLSERERQEAIDERVDRLARAEPERRQPDAETRGPRARGDREPDRFAEREAPRPRRPVLRQDEDDEPAPRGYREAVEPRRPERNRLEEAIERIELRAARAETHAARAVGAREDDRGRIETAIQEIERRAQRNEERTARALESLTGLVEARGTERQRLDSVVEQIEKRATLNEKRTAQALESLHGLVEARGGERERLQEAIAKVEARGERNAERTAKALESLTGLIDIRKGERDRLEAAIERIGKRAEETEARTARALESLTSLVKTAPQRASPPPAPPARPELDDDAVGARLDALACRAARAPALSPTADDEETFRLVSERLARRRKARGEPEPAEPHREPAQAAPASADASDRQTGDMQQELRRLGDKVDSLSNAAAGFASTQAARAQAQAEEIASALAAAAEKSATAERMERQVVQLAQLVERLVGASPAPAELAQAVKALSDVRAEIDRQAPGPALQALDRRVEELGRRIEAAAQRPTVDSKPFDDLVRRVEAVRVALERQAASRPDAGALFGAMQTLNEKIDRAATAGSHSAASLAQLQGLVGRLEEAIQRPVVDTRPFDDLARRIESMRVSLERQAASRPDAYAMFSTMQALADKVDRAAATGSQSAALLTSLQGMVGRLETAIQRPAVDPEPFDNLSRRVEAIRVALERQAASRPDAEAMFGALQTLNDKIDRAASSGAQSGAVLSQLQAMVGRLEESTARPAAFDARPLDDLARRIESVRGAVERQGGLTPKVDALHAAVGELAQKVERPAVAPAEIERLESALRQLGRQVEAALSRSVAIDLKPVEELARRIESVRKAMELQGAPSEQIERLEAQLAEIRARLDRPVEIPQMEAVGETLRRLATRVDEFADRPAAAAYDFRPIEELARRIDNANGAAERGFAPHAARLEAALGEIRAKVDEAASRQATVSLDPKPIEDLARRIESVRESLENPPTLGPHVERLESVLGRVAEKLEQAGPVIDANGINTTLAAMNARLEEAFRRPAQAALDYEPIEALAARVEAVRESIERQTEQLDGVGGPIDALAKRMDSLSASVERQANQFDAERIVEAVRGAVRTLDRPTLDSQHSAALTSAIETLANKLDRGLSGFDAAHIEDLLRQALERLDRPSVDSAHLDALTDAVAQLAEKVETPGAESNRVAALLERIDARLDRPADPSADLGALIDIVSGLAMRSGAPTPDVKRLEERLEQVVARLDRPGVEAGDIATMAEAISELTHKVDRAGGAGNITLLEDLTRDVAFRLDAIENKIDDNALKPALTPPPANTAALELAMREIAEKLAEIRAAADTRGVEHEIRQLQDRIDEVADTRMSSAFVEQAAQALARDVGERIAAATPSALVDLVREIHDRIDLLGSARTSPALESALSDLSDEIEALRSTRAVVDRGVASLSDIRAEQLQFDRRMDAGFTGVQDMLEKVVDRLGRLEREIAAEGPRAAPPAASSAAIRAPAPNRAAMLDIPDRGPGATRASAKLGATEPLTAEIAAQGRAREVPDAGKAAGLNAHIAAARRAASAAAADMERREEAAARETSGELGGLTQRAHALFSQHRRPVLLGAAGLMTVLTGAAVLEMRAGHSPVRKSELESPAYPSTPLAPQTPSAAETVDKAPTGAIGTEPRVITAPIAPPRATPKADATLKPAASLIAALPQGVGAALVAAGANGDLGAEVEIAQRYIEGRTVPRDLKIAADWLQVAADSGSPFAQYRLAALYEKGTGVARDLEKARALYKTAADAGNARAMHNLAVLYAQDGGAGKPDYAAAMGWFRKAADYGVRDSQFNLGVLYGRGLGATQDLAMSWMWFSLAAKQGDADAARKRDEVANRMDGRVMTAAKKQLDEFKAKAPDPALNDPPPLPAAAAAETPAPASDAPKAATSVKG